MKKIRQSQKEIGLILISFLLLIIFAISSKFYGIHHIQKMNDISTDIYEHPLKVSNAALRVQLEVYKIHRDMKDIVLSPSKEELDDLIDHVHQHEHEVYNNLHIIEENILGEEGLELQKNTYALFKDWKAIRDEVILLSTNNELPKAIFITKNKGAKHVEKLDLSASKLHAYAQNKATHFKRQSDELFNRYEENNFFMTILLLFAFCLVAYYMVSRISKYIYKNEGLTDELKKKSQELETIIQEAPNPMMLHDEDGKVLMVNKTWQELSGYTHAEIDTREKWAEKAFGENKLAMLERIQSTFLSDKKVVKGEFSINTKSGDEAIWTFSASPLGRIDGKLTVISSAMDITELKAKDKIMLTQSRYAAMGEMISMIAHQWRQPLAIIAMDVNSILLDIELGRLDTESVKETSHQIQEQTDHLSKTINDFRNFFKPENTKEKSTLKDVLDETERILLSNLKSNGISFSIENTSTAEILIHKRQLIQVLINIINNAKDALVEHTEDKRAIRVDVSEDKDNFSIRVCDNGGGIDESVLSHIFDPYFTTKEELNGTGLGLYMSKLIVTEHFHGSLSVDNVDEGACFMIKLPQE